MFQIRAVESPDLRADEQEVISYVHTTLVRLRGGTSGLPGSEEVVGGVPRADEHF